MNGDQNDARQPLHQTPIFRILALVIALLVLGALVTWGIVRWKPKNTNTGTTNQNTGTTIVPSKGFNTRLGSTPVDADQDGLTDDEETKLGTNPTLADTDRDELSDVDEVRVYHTDPKNADTDGDGHQDGAEVRQRFNPNGPGNLFDTIPPQEEGTNP